MSNNTEVVAVDGRNSKRSTISRFVATCMAVAALASLTACGSATGPDGVRVFGVVTLDGNGVGGVTISSAEGNVARSADTGWYEIHLQPGSHKLEFAKDGHPAVYRDVTVDGAEVNMDVDLAGGGGGRVGGGSLTSSPGVNVEYQVPPGPGVLEFKVRGIHHGPNKEHIAWGYQAGQRWRGGQNGGGAEWGFRGYKFKAFGYGNRDPQEPRYSFPWDPTKTYHVKIYWDANTIGAIIDGTYELSVKSYDAGYPTDWIIGLGWPPGGLRPGYNGAVYSDIKWPAGSVQVSN